MEYRICLFLFYLLVTGGVYAVVNKLECVLVGSTLRKNCSSNDSNAFWYRNSSIFQRSPHFEINVFTESNSGIYVCAHFNTLEVYSNYTLVAFEPIRIHSPLSYTVVLNETADILCSVTGRPELNFSWVLNNIPLNLPPNTKNIYIPSVSPDDIGTYECQVTNKCEKVTFTISVSMITINTFQLSQGAIIGIVVVVILCLFMSITCGFVACIQVRKYCRTVIRGSKSGSSRGSLYSDQSKLRQKKSIIHSSSHRNSITDLFVQDGIVHDNPVFIEGIANEKGRAFSNLIGIPQTQLETERTSHLSLAGSTTGGKHYSSDDLELKPVEDLEPTPEIKRSKSMRTSRVEKKEFLTEISYEKPAPYEHRFSPKVSHSNPRNVPVLISSRGMRISDTIAETRKKFDNPDLNSSPPNFRAQFEVELKTNLAPIVDKQRKISLDDSLRVTPGDLSDFLMLGAKEESDSSDEDELVSALPIKMPHSSATRHSQEQSAALKEFQKPKRDVSFDELDKHFHVLDTFVSPATFLSDTRQKRISSAVTKSKNLESILEESPSMVRMAESGSTRLGVRRAVSAQQKVSRFHDEGDPWKAEELANIPNRIVATRSMRFDPDY